MCLRTWAWNQSTCLEARVHGRGVGKSALANHVCRLHVRTSVCNKHVHAHTPCSLMCARLANPQLGSAYDMAAYEGAHMTPGLSPARTPGACMSCACAHACVCSRSCALTDPVCARATPPRALSPGLAPASYCLLPASAQPHWPDRTGTSAHAPASHWFLTRLQQLHIPPLPCAASPPFPASLSGPHMLLLVRTS